MKPTQLAIFNQPHVDVNLLGGAPHLLPDFGDGPESSKAKGHDVILLDFHGDFVKEMDYLASLTTEERTAYLETEGGK